MPMPIIRIRVIGEGTTDLGNFDDKDERPDTGILPVFLKKLCENTESLRVDRVRFTRLNHRGGLDRKVYFEARQLPYASYRGLVFVMDTEGENPEKKRKRMEAGRDRA